MSIQCIHYRSPKIMVTIFRSGLKKKKKCRVGERQRIINEMKNICAREGILGEIPVPCKNVSVATLL